MEKPQLIALGVIVSGLFFFGVSIFLFVGGSSDPKTDVDNSVTSQKTTSANTPLEANRSKTSTPPTASKTSTRSTPSEFLLRVPENLPNSSVEWLATDSTYGSRWKVILTSDTWFDTGIPYITNDTVNITRFNTDEPDSHTLIKINDRVHANKDGQQNFYFDRDGFSPNIRDTVKLKLDGGTRETKLKIVIVHVNGICPDYEKHKNIHEASIKWSDEMVNRTKK